MQTKLTLTGKIDFPRNVTKKHHTKQRTVIMIRTYDDLESYYRWFIFKRFGLQLNSTVRGSHITIVSEIGKHDWSQHQQLLNGKPIDFVLHLTPKTNGKHWWLPVESLDAENVRSILGLPTHPFHPFHLTIGYSNERNQIQSDFSRIYLTCSNI